MLFTILQKNPVNVGMRTEVRIYNIIMYLNDKIILEYFEIVGTEHKSMIHDNEGHSNTYTITFHPIL